MSDQDAIDIAEEAISKKKYNPFERAKDRGYPQKEVTIYWDEVGARKLVEHQKELDKLQAKVAYGIELLKRADEQMKTLGDANNKKAMTELQKAKDEATKELQRFQADFDAKEAEGLKLAEQLESTGVTFGLRGFSPEADDAMQEKVNAAVPADEDGERTADQVAEWSRRYNAEVISGAIEWHQPHGEEKRTQKIDPEVILEWRRDLPEESYLKLIQAVSDVAKGKEYFLALENAGFLAKS